MLAAEHRLRHTAEINRVYKRGAYGAAAGLLSLRALPTGRPHTRVAVVVSKKIDKRAVVRNRIRRRLTGLLQAHWGTVAPGYDIVVSVHADLSHLATPLLFDALRRALERAGTTTR